MNSIRLRLIALFMAVTTATLGVFAFYEQTLLRRDLENRFLALQDDVSTRLEQSLAQPVWDMDQSVIKAKLEAAMIPLEVQAVYFFTPDQQGPVASMDRALSNNHQSTRARDIANEVVKEIQIFPPLQVDETRRKTSIGKVVVYFSRAQINQALADALLRRVLEVLVVNALLLIVLLFSLRLVFVPLRGLRDGLRALASNEAADLQELPRTHRVEFDEVINSFNSTLRKVKTVISRHRFAETAAQEATRAANEALAQVKVAQAELVTINQQLERLTVTDALTGVGNRMKLDQVLENELNRSQRSGSQFALVLLDVDHFKQVNDTRGHQVGDLVLIGVAQLLVTTTRSMDIVGRWGGEEFLVICPDTNLAGAVSVADKLREAIASHRFGQVGQITASFGVACARAGDSVHSTLARADRALYRAKASGRDRVESEG
ncbi:GGDEF domain-containing protein [Silvimonas sp.]|uniref:GGDEF domain-containing protein n=1 Tax=Silvimonas sp. TaxID=2650811 RepID=UPI002841355F|nr:GGDEF domain-containing protein [Silvimonas sp.]MDR3427471.1 GGDEF domain-containing protein [Silvimonas sp.]